MSKCLWMSKSGTDNAPMIIYIQGSVFIKWDPVNVSMYKGAINMQMHIKASIKTNNFIVIVLSDYYIMKSYMVNYN